MTFIGQRIEATPTAPEISYEAVRRYVRPNMGAGSVITADIARPVITADRVKEGFGIDAALVLTVKAGSRIYYAFDPSSAPVDERFRHYPFGPDTEPYFGDVVIVDDRFVSPMESPFTVLSAGEMFEVRSGFADARSGQPLLFTVYVDEAGTVGSEYVALTVDNTGQRPLVVSAMQPME